MLLFLLHSNYLRLVDVFEWDKVKLPSTGEILKFDAISCLNLLDRCDKPITLLQTIKKSLAQNGILIVALVLPFKPYVEYNKNNKPSENLFENFEATLCKDNNYSRNEILNQTDNAQHRYCTKKECISNINKINKEIDFLINHVFSPLGFDLVKFTKLPYLCEGNLSQSFYYLLDYIFVFKSV